MKKKAIIGTVLFIAVGLFMFTFANPNDKVADEKDSKQTVKEVSTESVSNEGQEKVEPKEEKKEENTAVQTTTTKKKTNTTTRTTTTTTNTNNNVVTPATPADNTNNDDAAKKEAEEKAKKDAEELAKYKEEAKKELIDYSKTVVLDETTKQTIVDEYIAKIDEATTKPEVDKALEDGKKALDEAAKKEADEKAKLEAEDLAKYKEAAKEELEKYKKDEDFSNINDAKVTEIKNDGYDAIDDAKTKEEVDKALQDAKDLIDALDTTAPVITVAADETVYQKVGKANINNYTVTDNKTVADKIKVTTEIKLNGKVVNEVNYNVVGTYKITYTATDESGNVATATRTITVLEVKATALVLKAGNEDVTNVTDEYVVGTTAKTIKVYVRYNNGDEKALNKMVCNGFMIVYCTDGYTVNGSISTSHVTNGNVVVKYFYKGLTATYTYKVVDRKVVSLTVNSTDNTYIQGKKFNITVDAKWNDGKVEKDVKYRTTANTNTVGENQTAVISYKGATTNYIFNVIERKVDSLEVISNNGNRYLKGAKFDITVNAKWNDGTVEKNVKYTTTANTNTVGENQTAVISYKGATANYVFDVYERKVVSLEVISNDTNRYLKGAKFNITVNAKWNDGTVEKNVKYTTTANTNTVGDNQTAVISYKGATANYVFDVYERKVVSLEIVSSNNDYIKGEKFNITVNAKWNDGTVEKNVDYTTTANTNTVGYNQTATISYKGATATYTFNVKYELHLVSNGFGYYYLEFKDSVNIQNIKYYDKNGKNAFTIGGGNTPAKIYSLTYSQYSALQTMKGNNAKQKLVVTVKEGNKNAEYTYTIVVSKTV